MDVDTFIAKMNANEVAIAALRERADSLRAEMDRLLARCVRTEAERDAARELLIESVGHSGMADGQAERVADEHIAARLKEDTNGPW